MDKKLKVVLGVGVLAIVIAGFFLGTYYFGDSQKEVRSINEYAHEMIQRCADAPYRPTCYEQEVPTLASEMPTEQIFDVIRQIRRDDPEYLYCHVLAHELGTYEVGLDPDNWLNVIATGPTDGMCSNGYAHGALVARFNDEDLSSEEYEFALENLAIACEEREDFNPTDLTKAICYHGIGHVLIHMTLSNIDESLHGCETVGLKTDGRDYRQLCTEGVYMQLFQPLEPEDFALVDMLPYKPVRDNIEQFCTENSKNTSQYGACWREAWPLFSEDLYDSKGVTDYCSHLTDPGEKNKCFISAFTINGRSHLGEPEEMAATCNGLSSEYKGMCFARGANAFPEEDPGLVSQAIDMCNRANEEAAKDECFGFLANVAAFNFHVGSAPYENMCTSLPEKWEGECRRAE